MSIEVQGGLRKLEPTLADPVSYVLRLAVADAGLVKTVALNLNDYLGQMMRLEFQGGIQCIHCSRSIKKTWQNGYCYPCFKVLARCDQCIVRPERCHYHLGTCREPDWGQANCFQSHTLYLANTSGGKVGITRSQRVVTRWLDQGAVQGLPILTLPTRRLVGLAEAYLAQHMPDKTHWRAMLKRDIPAVDLLGLRADLLQTLVTWLPTQSEIAVAPEILAPTAPTDIVYPYLDTLDKIQSLTLTKHPVIEGQLLGIKGQYLILDAGVFNIWRHAGYQVMLGVH